MVLIDFGGILSGVFWILFWLVVVVGVLALIMRTIEFLFSDVPDIAKGLASLPRKNKIYNEYFMTVYNQLELDQDGKIPTDINEELFQNAISVYKDNIKKAFDDNSIDPAVIADSLAEEFFDKTYIQEGINFILDYRVAGRDTLVQICGKESINDISTRDREFSLKYLDMELILRRRESRGVLGEEQRDCSVLFDNVKVLDATISDSDVATRSIYKFKPDIWILQLYTLLQKFEELYEKDRQLKKVSQAKNRHL